MAPAWWGKTKKLFLSKDPSDPFLKVVEITEPTKTEYQEFMMQLDTGCEASNLIGPHVIEALGISTPPEQNAAVIGVCLNGQELRSGGNITLKWRAKGFRKVFTTRFEIVAGQDLPWDIILGAKTIREHNILRFGGFGLHVVPKSDHDPLTHHVGAHSQVKEEAVNDLEVLEDM